MKIITKTGLRLFSILIAAAALLGACANPDAPAAQPPDKPPLTQAMSPADEPSVAPPTAPTSDETSKEQERNIVRVVYFHRPQRCPSCLCFEERVRYVIQTYFQEELDSGRMTFAVYNIGVKENAGVVKKYGAVGSQLFINRVSGGNEEIRDIQEIWDWSCRSDKPGFDQKVKSVIDDALQDLQ